MNKLNSLKHRSIRLALLSSVVLLFFVSTVPAVFASSVAPLAASTGTCPSQAFLVGPPAPRLLILSIHWTVKADEDSGLTGYWALDHYTTHLKVWSLPDGSFYALKTYTGKFSTPQGAISPGYSASVESESAFGSIQGGYVATFNGQFTPGAQPTSGSIGSFNYGGTTSDVLKGSYGNGQTGATNAYDWTTAYFTNVQNFAQPHWGWAYLLNTIFYSGTSINQWCNYNSGDGGTSGDILV